MPPAAEWSKVVLRSVRGGLVSLARRIVRPEENSSSAPAQPHHEGEDPLGPLFDVLEALNSEQREFHTRLIRLEEACSPSPAQPDRVDGDPLGPLFDALVSINEELTGFAKRLARLEDAAVRAARSRRVRKAVPRA
ncbi:hypothetical protein OG883_45405 [Streptomyces sp. NBC_01142]|uniref:hypothetical protein n=1 Tax=Streptomyces sp. NBC_01142 TaxID=2975865 RepID=UPI002256A319|nr:hypothetical protein [Streptomyces sp. NBC_01142]MCX4826877.1 hypothetical protein [Streptomyces sp. NBC_01142]